jgi:LysR family glycine cleavage system transcriptional activator
MRHYPPINAIRAFDAVVRHGRFVKAADELHLTHGAVSKQIRRLEEIYDTQLFIRSAADVRLTSAGQRLHKSFADVLRLLQETLRDGTQDELSGELRLLMPPAFAAFWLMPRLSQFTSLYPEISLDINTSSEMVQEPDAKIDVTVRFGRPNWPDRDVLQFRNVSLFPVCSPELTLGSQPLSTLSDLRHFALLHEDNGELWAKWLISAKSNLQSGVINHHIADVQQLLQAARNGVGVALGDTVTARHFLENGTLVRPFKHVIRSPFSYYVISAKNDAKTQRSQAFIDWITTVK